ncbi:MAG: hypothetical protein R2850_04830 [Bacteroidia bacterium]
MPSEKKTHIVFNDCDDNVPVLYSMATGNKIEKKSASVITPNMISLPPATTDNVAKQKKWEVNINDQRVRITTIDETGNWSVNWYNPDNSDSSFNLI